MTLRNTLAASLLALAVPSPAAAQASSNSIFYSETWAGPVQIANTALVPNATSGFDIAEATLIMPHLNLPATPQRAAELYTASYWIGLDGFLPGDGAPVRGLWQAGVIMSVNASTSAPTYSGFYEWIPLDPVNITAEQLALAEGDHVHVRLNTTRGGLVASATLTNLNTSQAFEVTQNAPVSWRGAPTWPAPGTSAEWIVEAGTYLDGPQFVWPDFGNATFRGARACYNTTGECVVAGQAGAGEQITAMARNDTQTVYSSTTVEGDCVHIAYVEEPYLVQ
ncbi:unnamed protein product [Discula destructiva]